MTLKTGLGSLKVIENYTRKSGTHDFLLTFHSYHGLISHRFRDKRRNRTKIANFSHPVYLTPPLKRFPLELGSEETRMMCLPGGRKRFKIGLAVLIRVTDSRPASQSRCRIKYVQCTSASRSKKRIPVFLSVTVIDSDRFSTCFYRQTNKVILKISNRKHVATLP